MNELEGNLFPKKILMLLDFYRNWIKSGQSKADFIMN